MRLVLDSLVGGFMACAAVAAWAQASAPASAPAPLTAASKAMPARNPALTAAENAKEPGGMRPEERVVPQLSVPLKRRNSTLPAAPASGPAGVPGTVNDAAARCLAAGSAAAKAACERSLPASGPR